MTNRHPVHVARQQSLSLTAWFSIVVLAGCSGSMVGGNGGSSTGGGAGSNLGGEAGNAPSSDDLAPGLDPKLDDKLTCDVASVGVTPLRRLTNPEFDSTVADLFAGVAVGAPSRDFGFPADAFNRNFSNDASKQEIVRSQADGYLEAAQKLGGLAGSSAAKVVGCDPAKEPEIPCIDKFLDGFAMKAYRRPLTSAEKTDLRGFYQKIRMTDNATDSLSTLVTRILLSPQFLYRIEPASGNVGKTEVDKLNGWQVATRLSYLITGTLPDAELFEAARNDRLGTPDEVQRQAERLLGSPKARAVVRRFFREWLDFGLAGGIMRDPTVYAGFDSTLTKDLLEQAERLGESLFYDSADGLSDMWNSPRVFSNDRTSKFLGLPAGGAQFTAVNGDPARNMGFLTNAAVMAVSSHGDERKKPIFRGKWLRTRLLCQELPAPPADVPVLPKFDPSLSSRQQLQNHVSSATCNACHKLIDGPGFAFQNLDAAGRWTDKDGPDIADPSGELIEAGDADGAFVGVDGLANILSSSNQVKACVARELFRFSAGRFEQDQDACSLRDLRRRLVETGNLREAVLGFVATDAFRFQKFNN